MVVWLDVHWLDGWIGLQMYVYDFSEVNVESLTGNNVKDC